MAVTFSSVGATADFTALAGTTATDTGVAFRGASSVKLSTVNPAVQATATKDGVMADAGRRTSFWFRFNTLPPSSTRVFAQVLDTSGNVVYQLSMSATGIVSLFFGATLVNGRTLTSAASPVNTWWRISVSHVITSTTNFTIKVYVNGTLTITATQANGSLSFTGANKFVAAMASGWGTDRDGYFNSLYIDDGADLEDPVASEAFFGYADDDRPWFEPGTDVTGDLSGFSGASGGTSSATDQFHSSPRSVKQVGSNGVNETAQKLGVLHDNGRRGECWVRLNAYPATNPLFSSLLYFARRDGYSVLAIVVNTAGGIFIQPVTTPYLVSGTHVDDGTQTIALNTWTKLSWAYTIESPAVYRMKVWVNDVLSASKDGSYGVLDSRWVEMLTFNNRMRTTGKDVWFDDMRVGNKRIIVTLSGDTFIPN